MKRRMMSVKKSSGQLRRISSCISVNGTICNRIRPHHGVNSWASSMTFSFAASEVYGGEKKCTGSSSTPRFAIIHEDTGESIPPESSVTAVPPMPSGNPPAPGTAGP